MNYDCAFGNRCYSLHLATKLSLTAWKRKHLSWDLLSKKEREHDTRDKRLQVWKWGCRRWKMCTVYFSQKPISEQSSANRNVVHKCKTIVSPALQASTMLNVLCGVGLRRRRCVSLRYSNPAKDVIAWTAQNCLSLSDPWASSTAYVVHVAVP